MTSVREEMSLWNDTAAAALGRVRGSRVAGLIAWLVVATLAVTVPVSAQMPDLSQMSGRPLPSGDLPAGTVSVRVVRGGLSNNLTGVDVRLDGGPQPLTVKTDGNGRAIFSGLAQGVTWRAVTTVDGERLGSDPFTLPASGGIRLILVAGLQSGAGGAAPGAATPGASATPGSPAAPAPGASGAPSGTPAMPTAPASPGVPGQVTLGGQSRFVIELAEGSLEVYGLLEVANLTASSVMPAQPIVIDAPAGARNVSVLENSSPQATAEGTRVTVRGPFAPGSTSVQMAYRLPTDGGTQRLTQVLPLRLGQTTVIVRKIDGLQIQLPNAQGQRDVPLEGRTYVVINGGPLEAGTPLNVTISGLPHHPMWPRYVALALAVLIVIGGVVLAVRSKDPAGDEAEVRTLQKRRASLFEQLVSLERRRIGKAQEDPALLARRDQLMADIEALDDALAAVVTPAAAAAAAEPRSERLAPRPAER